MGINHAWLTEKPESPSFGGDKDNRETTRIYSINKALTPEIENILPAYGEYDSVDGYFIDYKVSSKVAYDEVYLKYITNPSSPGSSLVAADNEVKYDLTVNIVEKPLEEARNLAGEKVYRTIWNYNLYQSFEIVDADKRNDIQKYPVTVPSWVDTATDFSEADGVKYVWAKTCPSDFKQKAVEYFWKRVQGMSKSGVEAFIIAQAVVSEKKHCKRYEDALKFLLDGVGMKVPKKTFGWPTRTTCWLAHPVGMQSDGKYWIASNNYMYSDKWDSDLYRVL